MFMHMCKMHLVKAFGEGIWYLMVLATHGMIHLLQQCTEYSRQPFCTMVSELCFALGNINK